MYTSLKYVALVVWIVVGLFVIRLLWRDYGPYLLGEPFVTVPHHK
jgi:hypothetical protein